VAGVDLGAAMIAARQAGLVTKAGGHPMAAGLTLPAAGLPALHEFLCERLAAVAIPDAPELPIDGTLSPAAATAEFASTVARLAPFGAGNEEPLFAIVGAQALRVAPVGREGAHLRLLLAAPEGGARLKAIAFRCADKPLGALLRDAAGRPLHVVGQLRAETWQGETSASLQIIDAAPAGSA